MISNLESELTLVDRMQDALQGEMVRRQEMLRMAGNYANVSDYEADRLAGKHGYPPLPALFIVLDEFTEMLMAKPEFGEVFIMIGRLGRFPVGALAAGLAEDGLGQGARPGVAACPTASRSKLSRRAIRARFWASRTPRSYPRCPVRAS